mmetsp:Transcript_62151/g.115325  ORF Transcript_62151/g.115325 Transcript_62151/m.115325 type:complete len:490 (+) Transcript_62151:54-1523(+)
MAPWSCVGIVYLSVVAALLRPAAADHIKVDVQDPSPFHPLSLFFIYSQADAPDAVQPASVNFYNFQLSAEPAVVANLTYGSVEVGLIRYEDYVLLDMGLACDAGRMNWTIGAMKGGQQMKGGQHRVPQVFQLLVPFRQGSRGVSKKFPIMQTGLYVLSLGHCEPSMKGVKVTGDVIMKNPFGYLPGSEYKKLSLYLSLAFVYVGLGTIWLILSLIYHKELFNIQICIGVVLFMGLVEVSLWYVTYFTWNKTGDKNLFMFYGAIFASVVKSIFSYMLVLVGAMGWGITRPSLDKWTHCMIRICVIVFIPLDYIRRVITNFQDTEVPLAFILCILLPCSIMNGLIFYWVFSSLGDAIDTLTAQKQTEKLKLFHRLWCGLVIALVLLTIGQLAEFGMVSVEVEVRWPYQWIFEDAVSHVLFILVLLFQMILFRPHKESHRYAYSQQLADEEADPGEEANQDPFTISDAFDDSGDEEFDLGNTPQPTTVGAKS